MKRSSISVRPSSDLASFTTAPLGLLKWLKFNVEHEGLVCFGWMGKESDAFLNKKVHLVATG